MGIFKRFGKTMNRGIFKPLAKAVESVAEDIHDEVLKPIANVAENVAEEVVEKAEDVVEVSKEVGKDIQRLERKMGLIKHIGGGVGMALSGVGYATGMAPIGLLGTGIGISSSIASKAITN